MPCSACGRPISAISPPSSSIRATVASKTARTPGSSAASPSSRGTPKRRPVRSSRLGSSIPPAIPTEVESRGSLPCITARRSAASVTSRVSGPHWSSEEAKAIMPKREIAP